MLGQLYDHVSIKPTSRTTVLTSDKNGMSATSGDFQNFLNRVLDLFEVDEFVCAKLQACLLPLSSSIHDNSSETHGNSQLNSLHADTTATAREDGPLARAKTGLLDGCVCSTTRAHDGPSDLIRNTVRDERSVAFRRNDVLLVRTYRQISGCAWIALQKGNLPSMWRPVITTPRQYVSLPDLQYSHVWQTSWIGLSPALWPTLRFLTLSPTLTMTPAPS